MIFTFVKINRIIIGIFEEGFKFEFYSLSYLLSMIEIDENLDITFEHLSWSGAYNRYRSLKEVRENEFFYDKRKIASQTKAMRIFKIETSNEDMSPYWLFLKIS